jgi:hypothetical protein
VLEDLQSKHDADSSSKNSKSCKKSDVETFEKPSHRFNFNPKHDHVSETPVHSIKHDNFNKQGTQEIRLESDPEDLEDSQKQPITDNFFHKSSKKKKKKKKPKPVEDYDKIITLQKNPEGESNHFVSQDSYNKIQMADLSNYDMSPIDLMKLESFNDQAEKYEKFNEIEMVKEAENYSPISQLKKSKPVESPLGTINKFNLYRKLLSK